jgi:hypothetical protein
MTQVARPSADIDNSNWGPSPLFPHVNTVTPNDGSPVVCPVPSGGTFDVQLQHLAYPNAGGPQVLTVRLDEALPGATLVTFFLLRVTQGGIQQIVGLSVLPTGTFTSYDLVLDAGDIALLGGVYTNLGVRVSASGDGTGSGYGSGIGSRITGGVTVPCCPNALPGLLHASLSNGASGSVQLLFNSDMAFWLSQAAFGSCFPATMSFICDTSVSPVAWKLLIPGNGTEYSPTSVACDPLFVQFTNVDASVCLGPGANNITVTVTK